MIERLQKYIARRGICSRRAAERLILDGLIEVNGVVITALGTKVDPESDTVTVDGDPVPREQRHKVLMLNKPMGYLSTCSPGREKGRSILELVPDDRRYFPVGRLDRESTGLLLITDDGELAYILTHPRFGCEKSYTVETNPPLTDIQIRKLQTGIPLEDGPACAQNVLRVNKRTVQMSLSEGRNREIRRMMEALGVRVVHLHRCSFAGLQLAGLPSGKWRQLRSDEIEKLRSLSNSAQTR
jgi:23S rRNA pseudouridine2605 synthase